MDRRHNLFVSSDGSVESGWTVYLEHSTASFSRRIGDSFDDHQQKEEEIDLSMVSDASSGPPIFRENNEQLPFPDNNEASGPHGRRRHSCFCGKTAAGMSLQKTGRKIKGTDERRRRCDCHDQTSSFLDDTASSDPDFNFNSESSTCSQNQFNTLRQSSLSGNQRQNNQWFKGKR